ncbi:MAG: glycosyltransferase [Sandaracinaceae bacterium]|nr:glycosyltransferase [Sandaracinaceae bacterium]
MNVLVLAALAKATGNAVTARRIASHLSPEHQVHLVDSLTTRPADVRALVEERDIDVAVGLHALLGGPFLRGLGIPYALVFGGTDLYEPVHELQQTQMARAVAGAARLIGFSPENVARAEWMWPNVAGRVEQIPQAVEAPLTEPDYSLRAELGLGRDDVLLLLPTGIRRVKDPLHVVEAVSAWHARDPRVHLAVAGALLEPDYVEHALPVFEALPGVHYVPALPRERMLTAIHEADVVINTSLSEGMCGVLLEAMCLRTPIVARRNAGNESLVAHGSTGLLYDHPDELVHWARALLASGDLRERLASTARGLIEERHSNRAEREAYHQLVDEIEPFGRPSLLPPPVAPADPLATALAVGRRIGLEPPVLAALDALVARVRADEALTGVHRELGGQLGTAPPSVAIRSIADADLEATLGRDGARTFLLLLALGQVPAAEARHAVRGVDEGIVRDTVSEIALWANHLHAISGAAGLTLELLEWLQRSLRGDLFTVGPLQFELRPFDAPIAVFRHARDRGLRAITDDGTEPARAVDLAMGTVSDAPAEPLDARTWRVALEAGSPILEMWIPGPMTFVSLPAIGRSAREAWALFARLAPETDPVGMMGRSWRLDPQVLELVPDAPGVHDVQRAVRLFPSDAPTEAQTIRRLFGPDVTRGDLAALPAESLDPFRRTLAELLTTTERQLSPRGGFVLREELEAMPEWHDSLRSSLAPGARVGIAKETLDALSALVSRLEQDADRVESIRAARVALEAGEPTDAITRGLAASLGEDARTAFLLLTLLQVPAAEVRHARRGIDPEITRRTLRDLSVWARHYHRQIGIHGITSEIVGWSQEYLRGDLLRVGALQTRVVPFDADLFVHRHRETRALSARTGDGRAVDLASGRASEAAPALDDAWELVLEPGAPVFDLHIPADTFVSLRRFAESLREAARLFAKLEPDVTPVAVAGEAWLLDPHVCDFLPRARRLRELQEACSLYPSRLREDKTIRRLFGPDVDRVALATLPREGWSSLQVAVADHLLASPDHALSARGGFVLAEELAAIQASFGV